MLLAGRADAQPAASATASPAPQGPTATDAAERDALAALLDTEVQSVFGASRHLQRLTEAPAAVTVVTAEEIQRYGWRTVADVLRSVRGFYISDDRVYGYVGMRGFQRPGDYNTRVLMLVDGHRVNDNVFSQAFLQDAFLIDLEDIDRIEVIRGPSSSLYGSSAFFGVINVVTRPTGYGRGPSASLDVGSLGLASARLRTAHTTSNGLSLDLSATLGHSDGLRTVYLSAYDHPDSSNGRATGLDYTDRRNVLGRAQFRGFAVRAGYNQRQRGIPSAAYGTRFNDSRSQVTDERAFVSGTWDGRAPGGLATMARLSFDVYNYGGRYPYDDDESPEGVLYLDDASGAWLTGELQASRQLGRHRLVGGVEYQENLRQFQRGMDDGSATPEWSDDRTSRNTGIYVQDEWRIHPKLLVSAGLRHDHSSLVGDAIKPRASAIFQPDDRTAVKLLHGAAFRAPNVYEMFYEEPGLVKSNPDLGAEEIGSTEVVIERYAGRRVRLSASAFRSRVRRLIDLSVDPLDDLVRYNNVSGATARGFDAEVEARWPTRAHARVSYTFARVHDDQTHAVLDNSPAHLAQLLVSAPLIERITAGLDARALSARRAWSGETAAAHLVANLTVGRPFLEERVRLSVTISNLTNTQFADPAGVDFAQATVPQNGRAVYGRLAWAF